MRASYVGTEHGGAVPADVRRIKKSREKLITVRKGRVWQGEILRSEPLWAAARFHNPPKKTQWRAHMRSHALTANTVL